MQSLGVQVGKFLCLAIGVGTLLAGQATKPVVEEAGSKSGNVQAYFEGRLVYLEIEASGLKRLFALGPWRFGTKVQSLKPSDKRANLYVVVPGSQHQNDRWREFDHNLIVSEITRGAVREWDVYYALVLDPNLTTDFHDEMEMIVAEQETFSAEELDLEKIPSIGVLRQAFKVKSRADLKRFERPNGDLPRLAIVSAGAALKASTAEPESLSQK